MKFLQQTKKTTAGTVVLVLIFASATTLADVADPNLTLKGDQDGTVFRSLTVEGENRVQIQFARPQLAITVDPDLAPGLILDDALDILDRTLPDLVRPFLATSVTATSNYVPRPWLTPYRKGAVAHFTPQLENVSSWKLQIIDSRGRTAMVFVGEGRPDDVIEWDGIRLDGTSAPVGYTYSFVLSARDEAGNQRRFVGDSFELPAFWRDDADGSEFSASGAEWLVSLADRSHGSPLSLATASGINLRSQPTETVRIVATHRTASGAQELAKKIANSLEPLVIGNSQRIVVETRIEAAAPADGTVLVSTRAGRS